MGSHIGPSGVHVPASRRCGLYTRHYFSFLFFSLLSLWALCFSPFSLLHGLLIHKNKRFQPINKFGDTPPGEGGVLGFAASSTCTFTTCGYMEVPLALEVEVPPRHVRLTISAHFLATGSAFTRPSARTPIDVSKKILY